jgi:hypothetical protein
MGNQRLLQFAQFMDKYRVKAAVLTLLCTQYLGWNDRKAFLGQFKGEALEIAPVALGKASSQCE